MLLAEAADTPIGRRLRSFSKMLHPFGYEEGANLAIEWRFAEGKRERLRTLAEELVRANVELIVTFASDEATEAAMQATRTIPIVMNNAIFPLERGLIKSLARPGGNVTGTTYAPAETSLKQIQIFRETAPGSERAAVLIATPRVAVEREVYSKAMEYARSLWMNVEAFHVTQPEDVPEALTRIADWRADGLWVATGPVVRTRLDEVAAFAIERRLPSFGTGQSYALSGGLMYYGPDIPALWQLSATYINRILKGAKPADLPVEQPRKYELIINAKTARAIGHQIPQSILLRADRVIE
jgi:putative ABC transport system substrate-binding protein